jgi:ankyrin repeat protein
MLKFIKFIALLALLAVIGRSWGMDVNPIDELRWALDRNTIKDVNQLFDSGKLNQKHKEQLQALFAEFTGLGHYGHQNKSEEIKSLEKINAKKLQILLNSNARNYIDINKKNVYGNTAIMAPLYMSALLSTCQVLELITSIADCFQSKKGQKITKQDSFEISRAQQDLLAVIDLLLAAGADVNIVNTQGDSPLALLEQVLGEKDPRIRKLLADKEVVALNQEALDDKLITAIKARDYDQVKELLAQGADVNAGALDYSGKIEYKSTMSYAISNGDLGMCRLLIENGANVHSDYAHRDPLKLAIEKGDDQICQFLIEHGAVASREALIIAFNSNNEQLIRAILASITPEQQKQLLKIVSTSLLVIQKAEPALPKDMQRFIQHPLINSLINDWVVNRLEIIKQYTSRAPGQRDFNFWEQMRKDLRNNAMRVLFGAPRGFWTGTMQTYKEEKTTRKVTKDIYKEEKATYLGETAQSYYRILGVPTNATTHQINEAFERRIQPYLHETYQTGISPEHEQLIKAWSTLVNPNKREAYDQSLTIKQ